MKKEIINNLFGAIITIILTLFFAWIRGSKASIELSSVEKEDGKFYNTILIKNMQKSEYLENIEFIVDSNIEVIYVSKNEKLLENSNKIIMDEQEPESVNVVNFTTNTKITRDNLKLIKNGQKIDYTYFNDRKSIRIIHPAKYSI